MFVCPVPKISQVMIKWRRRASHLGRFTLWHRDNGCRATQLGRLLCGTTAAELYNSVNLLCGTVDLLCGTVTTAAELHISVDLLCGTVTTAAELHSSVDYFVAQRPPN